VSREGERKGHCGAKRNKVCYIQTHEDSIMKPTKHFSKEGMGRRMGIHGGGETVQVHCTPV
jgi:hypothetical protein